MYSIVHEHSKNGSPIPDSSVSARPLDSLRMSATPGRSGVKLNAVRRGIGGSGAAFGGQSPMGTNVGPGLLKSQQGLSKTA